MIPTYQPLVPYMLLVLLAVAVALLDTLPAVRRSAWLGWLTALGALAALGLDFMGPVSAPWQGMLRFDGYSRAFDAVFLLTLAIVAIGSTAEERKLGFAGEYYALLILSALGLMLMGSAGGLLALFLGLELSTICLFALVGFAKREKRSAEAALKMLVLGAVASAVVLYGISILYGVLGSTQFDTMATALAGSHGSASPALWLGLAFVIGGLAFKIAAAPFHLWAPDVYEGAPALVTAFLSTASKAGGFAALLRFLLLGMGGISDSWQLLVVALAVLSMVIGNLVALAQTNLKRLLAYSGIAQAGYILVAVAGAPGIGQRMSVGAALMYLFLYAFTNVGGFLLAQALSDATGSDEIAALRGLHRRSPLLAFAALVVLFSLGGIPPLAGFVGKVYLFAAGWQGGQQALVLIGALTSVVALYYYLMVARQVYISDPTDDRRMTVARPLSLALAVCVLGTLVIGIYPRPWVALGEQAALALRTPESGPMVAHRPR
jgi:NADH-quinone oxidoreductase subunit N